MDPSMVSEHGLAAPAIGLLVLRVLVGVPFSLHGFQKLFGWFGGGGLDGTASWFRSLGFGRGRTAAVMAGVSEIIGGLGLALGLLTSVAAATMMGAMTTAAFVNNSEGGFWSVRKGWELNGYLIVVAAAIALTGPGRLSVDHAAGFEVFWGVVPGVMAVVAGVGGGWMRWASRSSGAAATETG